MESHEGVTTVKKKLILFQICGGKKNSLNGLGDLYLNNFGNAWNV